MLCDGVALLDDNRRPILLYKLNDCCKSASGNYGAILIQSRLETQGLFSFSGIEELTSLKPGFLQIVLWKQLPENWFNWQVRDPYRAWLNKLLLCSDKCLNIFYDYMKKRSASVPLNYLLFFRSILNKYFFIIFVPFFLDPSSYNFHWCFVQKCTYLKICFVFQISLLNALIIQKQKFLNKTDIFLNKGTQYLLSYIYNKTWHLFQHILFYTDVFYINILSLFSLWNVYISNKCYSMYVGVYSYE